MPFRNSIYCVLSFRPLQMFASPWKMTGTPKLAGMISCSPEILQEHKVVSCNYFCSKSPINFPLCWFFLLLESKKICVFFPYDLVKTHQKSVAVPMLLFRRTCAARILVVWLSQLHPDDII